MKYNEKHDWKIIKNKKCKIKFLKVNTFLITISIYNQYNYIINDYMNIWFGLCTKKVISNYKQKKSTFLN